MNPGVAKLADVLITLALAGMERTSIVAKVREMEDQGKSNDEITDALQAMTKASEAEAQGKIDNATG